MEKFNKKHKLNIKKNKKNKYIKLKKSDNINIYNIRSKKFGYINEDEFKVLMGNLKRELKKNSFNLKIYPNHYLTSKPIETRMGKGKGNLSKKIIYLKKNQILLTISIYNSKILKLVIKILNKKINLKLYIDKKQKW